MYIKAALLTEPFPYRTHTFIIARSFYCLHFGL